MTYYSNYTIVVYYAMTVVVYVKIILWGRAVHKRRYHFSRFLTQPLPFFHQTYTIRKPPPILNR